MAESAAFIVIPLPGPGGTLVKHGMQGVLLPVAASFGDPVKFRYQMNKDGTAIVFSETGVGNCLVVFLPLSEARKLPGGVL